MEHNPPPAESLPPPPPSPEPSGGLAQPRPPSGWLALTALALYGTMLLFPLVHFPAGWVIAANVVNTLAIVGLSILLIMQVVRLPLRPLHELVTAVVLAWIWAALSSYAGSSPWLALLLMPLAAILFIILMAFFGRLLARLFREPSILLPVGLVVILADIFTVFIGPVSQVLKHAPQTLDRFSVSIPQAGSAAGPQGVAGLAGLGNMGLGDFIFIGLFLAAAVRFGLPARRGAAWIFGLLTVALGSYVVLSAFGLAPPGVPLLPFIGGGFLLAYRNDFRLNPEEKRAMWWGIPVFLAIMAGLYFAMVAVLPAPTPPAPGETSAPREAQATTPSASPDPAPAPGPETPQAPTSRSGPADSTPPS